MNTFFMFIFFISIVCGFTSAILFILSFIIKKNKSKRKIYMISFFIMAVLFLASAYGYDVTMSDNQRAEMEEKKQQKIAAQEAEKIKQEEEEKEKSELAEEDKQTDQEEEKEDTKEEQGDIEEEIPEESQANDNMNESTDEKDSKYDSLQNLFLEISIDTLPQDIEYKINEYSLYCTVGQYNKGDGSGKKDSYKIAYSDGAAKQKYADSGDYITVCFDESNGYKMMYAEYVNEKAMGCSALLYSYGTWYDFSEQNAEDYSGYYIVDSLKGKDKGIKVKYTNGREKKTNYFKYNSADEVIEKVINKSNK